ncbi:hypothetical protein E8E14_014573 [Neopestalotiopsis sp. 37M]|nr:hypothetical protein E8E14_014573 [Neopestalotiopsis sp. 37M]
MVAPRTQTIQSTLKASELLTDPHSHYNHFPHLPPYQDPRTGPLSHLPSSWIPYAQLMRLDRPAGLYAFYFPYLIGLMYAACISPSRIEPATILKLAVLLLPFNIVLRGAACTWNDNVDQRFDRCVQRCRHRPIARGAVSTGQAHVFTVAQLAALFLLQTMFPSPTIAHTITAVALLFVYALMKRVTFYPQVVLGFPFAWAIFFCLAALGVEPSGSIDNLKPSLALFTANILWTITYDTIYAHQDVADDEKAGVKSMALRYRNSTKILASILTICQLGLLLLVGMWAEFGVLYNIGTVGGVALSMAYHIYDVDLTQPESCGAWFHDQFWLVGAGYMAGLLCEYLKRINMI